MKALHPQCRLFNWKIKNNDSSSSVENLRASPSNQSDQSLQGSASTRASRDSPPPPPPPPPPPLSVSSSPRSRSQIRPRPRRNQRQLNLSSPRARSQSRPQNQRGSSQTPLRPPPNLTPRSRRRARLQCRHDGCTEDFTSLRALTFHEQHRCPTLTQVNKKLVRIIDIYLIMVQGVRVQDHSDLGLSEETCRVCHRVFSNTATRRRHELESHQFRFQGGNVFAPVNIPPSPASLTPQSMALSLTPPSLTLTPPPATPSNPSVSDSFSNSPSRQLPQDLIMGIQPVGQSHSQHQPQPQYQPRVWTSYGE